METHTAVRRGAPSPEGVAAGVTLRPGRTVIHDRVLVKVVEETAAVALGVNRSTVTVRVSAASGGLAVTVASALPIPPLDDDAAIQTAGSVLDRLSAIQETLQDRIGQITGREVTRVNITITGAIVSGDRRVK